MKKLLLISLIAISANCRAQSCAIANNPNSIWENNVFITTKNLIDYKRACFNDSSIYHVGYISDTTIISEDTNTVYVKEIKYYSHKTPTFDGFIEWIENKYKLKNK